MTRTYAETIQGFTAATWVAIQQDIKYLPESLASLTEVQDKTRKFILQFCSCNSSITTDFKNAGNAFTLLTFPVSMKEVYENGLQGLTRVKELSKAFLLVTQGTEVVSILDKFELISLVKINNFVSSFSLFKPLIGTDSTFASITENMTLVKNSCVFAGTFCSLTSTYKEWKTLEYEGGVLSNTGFTKIVGIVSNVFKLAIVSLSIAVSTTNLKNLTVETRFGKVTLNGTINVLSYFSTATALFKSIHDGGTDAAKAVADKAAADKAAADKAVADKAAADTAAADKAAADKAAADKAAEAVEKAYKGEAHTHGTALLGAAHHGTAHKGAAHHGTAHKGAAHQGAAHPVSLPKEGDTNTVTTVVDLNPPPKFNGAGSID